MMTKIVLTVFAAAAAYADYRQRRIPNKLILTGVAAGLISNLAEGGIHALAAALLGSMAGLALGYVFWLLHVFKAGDAKLIWMLGAILGWSAMWSYIAAALVFSGMAAAVLMIRHKIFFRRMKRLGLYLRGMILSRSFHCYLPEENDPVRMPFAVTSFLGIAGYLILKAFR